MIVERIFNNAIKKVSDIIPSISIGGIIIDDFYRLSIKKQLFVHNNDEYYVTNRLVIKLIYENCDFETLVKAISENPIFFAKNSTFNEIIETCCFQYYEFVTLGRFLFNNIESYIPQWSLNNINKKNKITPDSTFFSMLICGYEIQPSKYYKSLYKTVNELCGCCPTEISLEQIIMVLMTYNENNSEKLHLKID